MLRLAFVRMVSFLIHKPLHFLLLLDISAPLTHRDWFGCC
jgi:hypothetical protein